MIFCGALAGGVIGALLLQHVRPYAVHQLQQRRQAAALHARVLSGTHKAGRITVIVFYKVPVGGERRSAMACEMYSPPLKREFHVSTMYTHWHGCLISRREAGGALMPLHALSVATLI